MRLVLKATHRLQGKCQLDGVGISIENKAGSVRHWEEQKVIGEVKPEVREGKTRMRHDYGYVRGTEGSDGEEIDCFLGPMARPGKAEGTMVYVITTNKPPDFTELDEDKLFLGFPNGEAARKAFDAHYDDKRFFRRMEALTWEDFKKQARETKHGGGLLRGVEVSKASGDCDDCGFGRAAVAHRPRPRLVLKAHVKAYQRRAPSGEMGDVPEHEDRRPSAQPRMTTPRAPAVGKLTLGRQPAAGQQGDERQSGAAPAMAGPGGGQVQHPPVALPAPAATAISDEELGQHIASYMPIMEKALGDLSAAFPGVAVAGRLKETASLAEKLSRKGKPLDEIEDICGTRLTFDTIGGQQAAVARIKRQFKVRSEDDYLSQPKSSMGYRSYHMILEVEGRPVELQLRTNNQTSWSDWCHDYLYKAAGSVAPEAIDYAAAMSDHFACLDSGEEVGGCGPQPECPPLVRQEFRCLEVP